MKRRKVDRVLLGISIGGFLLMSVSFLWMPVGVTSFIPGLLFWFGLILGVSLQIALEVRRRSFFASYEVKWKDIQKPRNGLMTFGANQVALIADDVMILSVTAMVLAFIFTKGHGFVCYVFIATTTFFFCLHCILNGRIYFHAINQLKIRQMLEQKKEKLLTKERKKMGKANSLRNRLIAMILSMVMVLGMLLEPVNAQEGAVAKIGETTYNSLKDALDAVPTGTDQTAPTEATKVTLLQDTTHSFDVGISTGAETMNLVLDLDGHTLTLAPGTGSVDTKSNGIRVLAYSKLEIKNGTVVCSSEAEDNIKVGIANYGSLTLSDVELISGDLTVYTINNRGELTLNGKTMVKSGSEFAITNDPYNLYYTTDVNASVTCGSSDVVVDSMQVERYERTSNNNGSVELKISAGYFGKIVEDGNTAVATSYSVTGGTIGVSTTEELELALSMVKAGAEYACPETPVTIQLQKDLSGSFDVGISTGKAPKNIVLDLNEKTLTLKPGVGSYNTKSNGIRVLAYSKLEIKNGTVVCSSEEADNVKVGIANYSDLVLDSVEVKSGDLTVYTINNRGNLTLKGSTSVENGKVAQTDYTDSTDYIAITNDPYNLYYSTPINAVINCADTSVVVGNVQLETYGSKGNIELNIAGGTFGGVYKPAAEGAVTVKGETISGGSFDTDVSEYCSEKYTVVLVNGKYTAQYVKDDQTDFGFADPNPVEITFNDNENKFNKHVQNEKGTVTYSIESQKNIAGEAVNDVVEINAETGELTILKAGTVQVKASDTGNAWYNPAEATYTLVIKPAGQTGFKFDNEAPADQWIGAPYTNIASGGQGNGAVTYSIIEGAEYASIVETTGILTFDKTKGAGKTVKVKAVKAADDCYLQTEATYSITSKTIDQADFAFATTGPVTLIYAAGKTNRNPVSGGNGTGTVTYKSSDTSVAIVNANGTVTLLKSGEVTITAIKAADNQYNEATASYTLIIEQAEQTIAFDTVTETDELTYQPEAMELPGITGKLSEKDISYTITVGKDDIAKIDEDGKLQLLKSGYFEMTIVVAEDDRYKESNTLTWKVTVQKADQSGFKFATDSDTVTYNDVDKNAATGTAVKNQYTLITSGGQTNGDVTYEIEIKPGEESPVEIVNGIVKINKAGTVKIKATKAGDDRYNADDAYFTLTIEKANQSFKFDQDKEIEIKYGQTFETKIDVSELNSGAVSYYVSENKIGALIDDNGVVSFVDSEEKVGSITITIVLEGNDCYNEYSEENTYTINVVYETKPENSYTFAPNNKGDNGWYIGDVTIVAPEGYLISYNNKLAEDNIWEESVVWNEDGCESKWGDKKPVVYLKNEATGGITDKIDLADLKRDTKEPVNLSISYTVPTLEKILNQIFGFSKESVKVTVSAEDVTSGISKMEYSLNAGESYENIEEQNGSYSFTVPAEYRGQLRLRVTDVAGNDTIIDDKSGDFNKILIVDAERPGISVSYEAVGQNSVVQFPYNKNSVNAVIMIDEANFFEGDKAGENSDEVIHEVLIKVTKTDDNGVVTVTEYLCENAAALIPDADKAEEITWTLDDGKYTTTIPFVEDGDYVLEISYADFSGNESNISGTDGNAGTAIYTSKVVTIDKTAPVIEVDFDNNDFLNENCFNADRVATITVTEHNFKAEEFVVDVTTKNLLGDISVADYAAYAKNPANWTHNGNVHTLKILFEKDAIYNFEVAYADMAGNAADKFEKQTFVVDHTDADNIQITYTTPIFERIIEALSFGFYKADVIVTVTAEDMTSGIDYFELTYTRDKDATEAHADDFMQKLIAQPGKDGKTFKASYTVPAQARGSYSVKVFDRAGNDSEANDLGRVIVTDTVSPEIKVDFTAKESDTKVQFVDSNIKNVNSFSEATNAFFNGDVVVTITVDEANFFEGKKAGENNDEIVHEIIIKVTKTDDVGVKTVKEYLCAGAEQTITDAQKEIIEWSTDGDTHTASITFSDDGDYVLEIAYSDFSENDSEITGNDGVTAKKTYTSKIITVDETAPLVDVAYENTEVINTIENIKYFNKTQSAIITVTEHNFRAEDIIAAVTAKDVVGSDVAVADFAALLANEDNWTHNGNVHTAKVNYTVDANYIFDIDIKDLALNRSADYNADLFTVDTTAPRNLTVDYSTSVFEQILESITFGYYNAQMTVTITAEDDTSGIYHFAYSYIKGQDVSGVNAELLDQAIKEAEITYDGKKATATFTVPKMVLGNDNQFNGTVQFTAFDRSEVSTELKDSTIIIVDNISPTANITYNAPVQNANGISYYDGNINATIVINEANFDAKDVVVSVTKNGTAFPVNVTWRDDNVDTHTGTFTLTDDGDYIVSVQYKDKSGNQMTSYTSNELTLDATKPTIKVSDIKANSANKDAEYGFVIEISDTNLDASSMKPVLKAVKQTAEDVYEIVEIDLGKSTTVVDGQTYTYTVKNLPEDGLYTLTCEVKDMSENKTAQIVLEDGQTYDQVQFSINRNGSAFGYGNEFTEELVGKYYIYSVDEDVVIVEVNVDPVEEYKVTLNGTQLVEGTDYTSEQTSNDGEWSKRTYTIKKDLFAEESEYSIIVSSTDKADTTAFSDIKNLSLAFVVDQTKPVLTITGLEAGGRYQTDAQTVTLIPNDEGGRLNDLTVVVLDADGNPLKDENGVDISVRFAKSGEELLKYLEENDGKVTFTIPEGLNNQVKIICNDCAVNVEDLTNEYNELFERVTVSQNQFVIFYANTPLFVGTIVGVVAVAGSITFLIARKRGKKSKEKVNG